MIPPKKEPATYAFGDDIADRLRLAVYQLSAAIDELLWRCRIDPEVQDQPGLEEMVFWENHAKLLTALRHHPDDDHF